MLYLRMALYAASGVLAGQGLVIFDAAAGTISIRLEDLATFLWGAGGFVATFAASRLAKARGGAT